MYKQVLDRINLPIVLWKLNDTKELICLFTNNKINGLKEGDHLKDYLKNNNVVHEESYSKILATHIDDNINLNETHITLVQITEDIYSEIHYPKCDDLYILYSISSKLRSPLTNIIGMITMLEDIKMPEKEKKYIGIIKDSSYDIVSLANDIVDMVNLKTNKIKLKYEKVSLNKIAEETSNIVLEDIKKKKLKFNIKVSDDLPDMVSVDPSRLVQIVVNMISNSLKHTSDGSINLDISLFDIDNFPEFPFTYSDLPDNKYHILFKIKDTGSGIDEDIKRIVDKVLNIKQINKIKSYKNTGFGLLICRDLCSLMGGNIWYKSEEDMGSIFYFTIICDGIKLK